MSAQPVDVLTDLRGVVRIAKAASIGVTGNGPRIERAEAGIAAVAELVEADRECDAADTAVHALGPPGTRLSTGHPAVVRLEKAILRRRAALARIGGTS